MARWWRPLDAREVLLWLADDRARDPLRRAACSSRDEVDVLVASMQTALETGAWSVADVALVDDLAARLGAAREAPREERGVLRDRGARRRRPPRRHPRCGQRYDAPQGADARLRGGPARPRRERLLRGRLDGPGGVRPRARSTRPRTSRRCSGGCSAAAAAASSWTVVGDAAQASWPDAAEARQAREEAFGSQERSLFHMDTNYRNAREIFDYARRGHPRRGARRRHPGGRARDRGRAASTSRCPTGELAAAVDRRAGDSCSSEVEGSVAVIAPARWAERRWPGWRAGPGRGCRSSTRCRPRAWSTTRRSSSTPTGSPRSPPVACACSTSR